MYLAGLGKEAAKTEFDRERQRIWERFVQAHDAHQQTGIAAAVQTIDGLLAEHRALYERMRPAIEASWIDPRFQDIQSFMQGVADKWRKDIPAPTSAPVWGGGAAAEPGVYLVPGTSAPAAASNGGAPIAPLVYGPAPAADVAPAAASSGASWSEWLPYILGAAALGLFLRRGRP